MAETKNIKKTNIFGVLKYSEFFRKVIIIPLILYVLSFAWYFSSIIFESTVYHFNPVGDFEFYLILVYILIALFNYVLMKSLSLAMKKNQKFISRFICIFIYVLMNMIILLTYNEKVLAMSYYYNIELNYWHFTAQFFMQFIYILSLILKNAPFSWLRVFGTNDRFFNDLCYEYLLIFEVMERTLPEICNTLVLLASGFALLFFAADGAANILHISKIRSADKIKVFGDFNNITGIHENYVSYKPGKSKLLHDIKYSNVALPMNMEVDRTNRPFKHFETKGIECAVSYDLYMAVKKEIDRKNNLKFVINVTSDEIIKSNSNDYVCFCDYIKKLNDNYLLDELIVYENTFSELSSGYAVFVEFLKRERINFNKCDGNIAPQTESYNQNYLETAAFCKKAAGISDTIDVMLDDMFFGLSSETKLYTSINIVKYVSNCLVVLSDLAIPYTDHEFNLGNFSNYLRKNHTFDQVKLSEEFYGYLASSIRMINPKYRVINTVSGVINAYSYVRNSNQRHGLMSSFIQDNIADGLLKASIGFAHTLKTYIQLAETAAYSNHGNLFVNDNGKARFNVRIRNMLREMMSYKDGSISHYSLFGENKLDSAEIIGREVKTDVV